MTIHGTPIRRHEENEESEKTYLIHRNKVDSLVNGGLLKLTVMDFNQFPEVWNRICHSL